MLPTRIQVGHKALPDEGPSSLPFTADCWGASGVYHASPANRQLVFGSVDHRFESEIENPSDFNEALDPDVKTDYLSCLAHRLPSLPMSGEIHVLLHVHREPGGRPSGHRRVAADNFFLCNGFSGHGFKLRPLSAASSRSRSLARRARWPLGDGHSRLARAPTVSH